MHMAATLVKPRPGHSQWLSNTYVAVPPSQGLQGVAIAPPDHDIHGHCVFKSMRSADFILWGITVRQLQLYTSPSACLQCNAHKQGLQLHVTCLMSLQLLLQLHSMCVTCGPAFSVPEVDMPCDSSNLLEDAGTTYVSCLMSLCWDLAPCNVHVSTSNGSWLLDMHSSSDGVTYSFNLPSAARSHPFVLTSSWHALKDQRSYTDSIAAHVLARALLHNRSRCNIHITTSHPSATRAALDMAKAAPGLSQHSVHLTSGGGGAAVTISL